MSNQDLNDPNLSNKRLAQDDVELRNASVKRAVFALLVAVGLVGVFMAYRANTEQPVVAPVSASPVPAVVDAAPAASPAANMQSTGQQGVDQDRTTTNTTSTSNSIQPGTDTVPAATPETLQNAVPAASPDAATDAAPASSTPDTTIGTDANSGVTPAQ